MAATLSSALTLTFSLRRVRMLAWQESHELLCPGTYRMLPSGTTAGSELSSAVGKHPEPPMNANKRELTLKSGMIKLSGFASIRGSKVFLCTTARLATEETRKGLQ